MGMHPSIDDKDADGTPDLFLSLNKIESDIVTTYHPLDFHIASHKSNKAKRQKYVVKSITNASPDVVIMEEANKSFPSTTEKLKMHKKAVVKTNSNIVDVKKVSNGKNSNSTLYRIKKKRRKNVATNQKRPKMI